MIFCGISLISMPRDIYRKVDLFSNVTAGRRGITVWLGAFVKYFTLVEE
jgi:hypothetical protein